MKLTEEQRLKRNERQRDFQHGEKEEAIKAYGGCCKLCGESRIECLTIIKKMKEDAKKKRDRIQIYIFLNRANHPKGYEIQCKNCIAVKGGDGS